MSRATSARPTLDYLIKGGRIGLVAGTVGKLLNIKPIISCNDEGKYYTLTKVPGARRAISRLCDLARDMMGSAECDVTVLHGCAPDDAVRVLDGIKKICNVRVGQSTCPSGRVAAGAYRPRNAGGVPARSIIKIAILMRAVKRHIRRPPILYLFHKVKSKC